MANQERIKRWFTAVCTLPWLLVFGAYTEALCARLVLSRWPQPSFDDPKNLSTAPIHFAVLLLTLSVFGAIPFLIVFIVWKWRMVRDNVRYAVRIGIFSAGLLAILLLFAYDPGHVWTWLVD